MSHQPLTLQSTREHAIDVLCRAFAEDAISMAELDRRLDRARSARTRDELNALLADLKPATAVPATRETTPAGAPATTRAGQPGEQTDVVLSADRASSHLAFAVMGGARRAGRWVPPSTMVAVAIMGGVELDFRDAVLREGVTDINVFAFWGGVEIIVPPDVHVDSGGIAIMGGFEQLAERESNPPPGAPVIRVNGLALMAGVEIKVREKGEDVEKERDS